MKWVGVVAFAALALCGCQSAPPTGELGPPQMSDDFMKGGQYREPWLSAALKDAANHPLGSAQNPVRADMPGGERMYLARLRCADGKAPAFARTGNLGAGAFGSIVDDYIVRCAGSSPAETHVVMDMYFSGYQETQPVPGFTIAPP